MMFKYQEPMRKSKMIFNNQLQS